MRDPGQPSKEEIDEHNVDQTPYRSWCPSCVKARVIGAPHRSRRNEQEVLVFGFDYLRATELQISKADSLQGHSRAEAKMLVAHCQKKMVNNNFQAF